MAAALVYTLPTLQLVCHLVTTGNSTIVGTTPGTTPAPSPSPIPALPNGYVAFPDVGVAYKIHREGLSWVQAKAKCAEEGGHLADIDSDLKLGLFSSFPGGGLDAVTYTGIHLVDDVWHSDRTGLPVSNLPWADREPYGGGSCALMRNLLANRLGQYGCDQPRPFICQIRYP